MKLFRYSSDRIPVTIFITYFFLDIIVFFNAKSLLFLICWLLLGILPKAFVSAWNHHHQHVPTFKQVWLNRLLEIMYAFQTGISTNGWVLHHVLGHHQHYLDQKLDESRWKDQHGRKMDTFTYSLITTLTGYPRAYQVGRQFPQHQKPFVGMALVVITLILALAYYNWINTLFVFVIPGVISLYITAWHTYYHHAGLETEDHLHASYNITEKWYNIFTGNLGYHTAHHLRMGTHWSLLPKYHAEISHKIPPHLYRKPPYPFRWLCP